MPNHEEQIELYNLGAEYPQCYESTYVATKHVMNYYLKIPDGVVDAFKARLESEHFFMPEDSTITEILTGILRGNIILQGPPGTGKTTLTKIICDLFNTEYDIVTATSDWTTYDTIGGYQPSVDEEGNEIIEGKNGKVINSIIECCNTIVSMEKHGSNEKQAKWLIIDELNRSEIDKVFGDLFTVFGSNDPDKRKLRLWFQTDTNKKELFVPYRYRIIGVINNVDKNFVFNLSQGLIRRFSFITINPPPIEKFNDEIANIKNNIVKEEVVKKLSGLGNGSIDRAQIDNIFSDASFRRIEERALELIKHIRYYEDVSGDWLGLALGSAQIIDMYEMTIIQLIVHDVLSKSEPDKDVYCQSAFDVAIADQIVPQMEGFYFERLVSFKSYLDNSHASFTKSINQIAIFIN